MQQNLFKIQDKWNLGLVLNQQGAIKLETDPFFTETRELYKGYILK